MMNKSKFIDKFGNNTNCNFKRTDAFHIFGLANFPDFPVFYSMNLTDTKIYLTNTLQINQSEKK